MATERPKFNIPKQELPGFKALARTAPESLQKLTEELSKQPPSLDVDRLAGPVARASGIEQSIVEELLPVLWRLTMVQRRLDLNAEDFVNSLAAGLGCLPDKDWDADDRNGWANVSDQLRNLLASDTAVTSSVKASELLEDQQLLLCKSRVITDMRAVFDDSAQSIKGILPYHTIVLRCHEGSNDRDIYVAIDLDDLVLLRQQLERAEQKEKVLRSALQSAGLTLLETSAKTDD